MIYSDFASTTFLKNFCKTLGVDGQIAPYLLKASSITDLINRAQRYNLISLPDDKDYKGIVLDESVEQPIINFINFSAMDYKKRYDKSFTVKRGQRTNALIDILDSVPDNLVFLRDRAFKQTDSILVACRSNKPILKRFINTDIPGGIILSTLIPNDPENEDRTSVFQMVSLRLLATFDPEQDRIID